MASARHCLQPLPVLGMIICILISGRGEGTYNYALSISGVLEESPGYVGCTKAQAPCTLLSCYQDGRTVQGRRSSLELPPLRYGLECSAQSVTQIRVMYWGSVVATSMHLQYCSLVHDQLPAQAQ